MAHILSFLWTVWKIYSDKGAREFMHLQRKINFAFYYEQKNVFEKSAWSNGMKQHEHGTKIDISYLCHFYSDCRMHWQLLALLTICLCPRVFAIFPSYGKRRTWRQRICSRGICPPLYSATKLFENIFVFQFFEVYKHLSYQTIE